MRARTTGLTPELTVLLPCLDEAATVGGCVRQALAMFAAEGVLGEVVVADNGSSDGSVLAARRAGARVVPVAVRGYGAAVRAGIAAARGTYVIMADADGTYDLAGAGAFLAALRGGADLVVGDRYAGGIAPGAMPLLHRLLGNPVLSLVGRRVSGTAVRDVNCGLRGFRRTLGPELGLTSDGFELCVEMVIRAGRLGVRIEQLPTTLAADLPGRVPHLRTWSDGAKHLALCLRLWGRRAAPVGVEAPVWSDPEQLFLGTGRPDPAPAAP